MKVDLQDFDSQLLYFDYEMPDGVEELIKQGAEHYSEGNAEEFLLRAFDMAPENLSVLVALYRFYYYQHQYEAALNIAKQAMAIVAQQIDFPEDWQELDLNYLGYGLLKSFTLVRFYLFCLKGAGYLNLRLGNTRQGVEMLNKVIEMDTNDRIGAKVLMQAVGPATVS